MKQVPLTVGFGKDLEDIIGTVEINDSPYAKLAQKLLEDTANIHYFAIGYIEHKDGRKELVEVSLVTKEPTARAFCEINEGTL